jgi:hypothetical protein
VQKLEQLQSGKLADTTHLKLSCGLAEFPQDIFRLSDSLHTLDLSGNKLSILPSNFSQLKNLQILFLSDNNFVELEIVGFKANKIKSIPENSLPLNLRWLILTDNRIEQLPKSIGNCSRLQKVMLAGNRLTQLPDEMALCKNIELLRISANKIRFFPQWLFTLPRLTWLAFAGNSFTDNSQLSISIPTIDWNELVIQEQLGQGASGIIYKATWRDNEVAAKIFKGEVTSDGWPLDEMNACITVGSHLNIVNVQAQINNHPEKKNGLVFNLIPPEYKNLGGSPDFKTCTRDTFREDASFTIDQIFKIALSMAESLHHLHKQGIMHGDFYAHNILIDDKANSLLSDFGAATIYPVELKNQLERLDVRAFGCLLDDLLTRVNTDNVNDRVYLNLIKDDCFQDDILSRPDFESILTRLREIAKINKEKG